MIRVISFKFKAIVNVYREFARINREWPLKDRMILNKSNFYKHMFFQFFIILLGNIISEFSVF